MCTDFASLPLPLQVVSRVENYVDVKPDGDLRVKEEEEVVSSTIVFQDVHRVYPTVTGPKYFVPDVVYAPSEVDPDDVLNIPDGSEASHERLVPATSQHVLSPLRLATWNVAGARAKRVKLLISSELDFDVLALQEHPEQKATGWQLLKGEVFHGLLYQNYLMYRSVMLLYNRRKFHLLGRRASERGIWANLQRIDTGKKLWVGSLHLPNNESRDETQRLLHEFLKAPPGKADTCMVLGDMNTQFRWTVHEGICSLSVVCTRWSDLWQGVAAKGYSQLPPPPHQASAPTFHSRKQNVTNAQATVHMKDPFEMLFNVFHRLIRCVRNHVLITP